MPFGVGGHDAVLDAVVDHLHEVPGAGGPAVEVAVLGGAADLLAAGRAGDVAAARGERLEDRIEALHRVRVAADHHAVAALEPPDAAAGADVDVVDALRPQVVLPADVVDVVGVAAVDQDVVASAAWARARPTDASTTAAGTISHTARGGFELRDELVERARARRAFARPGPSRSRRCMSQTTHSWPAFMRRRTMFAPIRPRPIIPSCMVPPEKSRGLSITPTFDSI